ncbi:helix-turn-helix domain-containing protein [Dactylosporangium sp. NPDC050688]|uniref:helix-turn-helix domain-containing protein n=1 Tax=Dactylosporangium sp. NPDC050688 TaxID=3157217 RepID=UPI00341108B6
MANELSTGGGVPDPQVAASAAEFVAQMRALRQWSGLTIRQVARKAQEAGDVLPHSTLAAALSRPTLPREELVEAFVRACGSDRDTVDSWIAVRKRLAVAAAGAPEPVAAGVAAKAGAGALADEPRVRPPWGLLDEVRPLPPELSRLPGWDTDDAERPRDTDGHLDAHPSGAPATADEEPAERADGETAADATGSAVPVAGADPAAGVGAAEPTEWDVLTTDADQVGAAEPVESAAPVGTSTPTVTVGPVDDGVPTADRPVRVPTYAEGTLATAVKSRRNEAWSGLHRKRAPETDSTDGTPSGPLRPRDFVPPLVFRAGWSARVLLGVLVVLLVLVAVGVSVRTFRDPGSDAGPAGATAEPAPDVEESDVPATEDTGSASSEPVQPNSPAPATRSAAPNSPKPTTTPAAAALPGPGRYRMMPAATAGSSYCVGAGTQPGNGRPDVAVLTPCAGVTPATSELRKVGTNTYQIFWPNPGGGGGCLQVDPDTNGQPSTADGQLVAPRSYCDRPDQRFVFEPVQSGADQGYRLHAATAPRMCIGPIGGGRSAGTVIAQLSCSGDDAQVFLFKP